MENKGYADFWGANKVYYGEFGNGEFTSVAEKLNSGLQRTTTASGQNGI